MLSRYPWAEWVLLVGLTILTRMLYGITHPPVGDELFQYLAALSWVDLGVLQIDEGTYTRAAGLTILLGEVMRVFGTDLVIPRAVVLFFGLLWILAAYTWIRAKGGRLVAGVTVAFLVLAPHAIELSLYVRMYTAHGLAFLLFIMVMYELALPSSTARRTAILLACAIGLLGLAYHLHPITLIGLAGAITGVGSVHVVRQWTHIVKYRHHIIVALAMVVAAITIAGYLLPEIVQYFWSRLTMSSFADPDRGFGWYLIHFWKQYSLIWLLTPIFMIAAIKQNRDLGIFCTSTFVTSFIIHSIAGMSAERYIFYLTPVLYLIWGLAFACFLPHAHAGVQRLMKRVGVTGRVSQIAFVGIIIAAIVAPLVYSSDAARRTVNLARGESYYFGIGLADWELARGELQPLIESSEIVVTTNFLKCIYHFGRFDVTFSPVVLHLVGDKEFSTDPPHRETRHQRCGVASRADEQLRERHCRGRGK